MAKPTPPTPTTRTPAPYIISAAIGAAAAALATLAAGRRSHAHAAAALLGATPKELRARADLLHAIAAHRDAVQRGERPLRAIADPDERRPRRTG